MFVTAFLAPKTTYRSVERYFAEFQRLTETGVPILLFLDTVFLDRSFPSNVRVIPTSLDMSWVPDRLCLPAHRNTEKDTVEYFCIQLSKLAYLVKAREYTDDEFLAWIDFGVFHMIRDAETCERLLRQIATSEFPKDTILAPGCWPSGEYDWNSVCWRFCGTFLLGHRDLFPSALERQTYLVNHQLPRLTWEVNYWAQMEEHFHVYMANHDDTLFSRVMVFVHGYDLEAGGTRTAGLLPKLEPDAVLESQDRTGRDESRGNEAGDPALHPRARCLEREDGTGG